MHLNNNLNRGVTEVLEGIIRIVCYISFPLILLFMGTIISSQLLNGNINTNVNEANSFLQVAVSFSLPMIITLAIIPLLIQLRLQHSTLKMLGFTKKQKRWSLIICIILCFLIIASTYALSCNDLIELSSATICFHYLIVAISEEVILRSVIMHEMYRLVSNHYILCIINALLFAFVYHSNEDFFSNLLVRVPLGFVLSYSRLKSGDIYLPIMLHWAYNIGITAIA